MNQLLTKGVGADAQASTPALEACVDDYDLGKVAKPWSDFVACEAEKQACQDHPTTLMKHCKKTCGTCSTNGASADTNTGATKAKCSTFESSGQHCAMGMIPDPAKDNQDCAGNPCMDSVDAQTCCKEAPVPTNTNIEFQGAHADAPWPQFGFNEIHRPSFGKFKTCMGSVCESCPSDIECGWTRSRYNILDTVDDKEHVAEFWADCAEGKQGFWRVETRVLDNYLEAFNNANTKVYLAEEGGHMKGELQESVVQYEGEVVEKWHNGMSVTTGSTRLYVVIKAKDSSKSIKVQLNVKIQNAPAAVGHCMDNKMCLSLLSSSAVGTMLRNDNTLQFQCLAGHTLNCNAAMNAALPNCVNLLHAECQAWKNCLDAHQADKEMLQALLASSQTTVTTAGTGQVTGDCAHPANDDPESWECECAEDLYQACAHRTDLSDCITELMCASDEVCPSWKQDKGCSVSMLAGVAAIVDTAHGRRQPFPNSSSLEPALLEQSLSGKACARTSR